MYDKGTHNLILQGQYKILKVLPKIFFSKIPCLNPDPSFKTLYLSPKWTWRTQSLIWNLLPKKSKTLDTTKKDFLLLSWERLTPKVPSWSSSLVKWSSSDLSPKKMLKKWPERPSETSPRLSASRPKSVTLRWPILWQTPKLAGQLILPRLPMKRKVWKMKAFQGWFIEASKRWRRPFCSVQAKWFSQERHKGAQ